MKLYQEYYYDAKNQIWVRPQNFTPRCTFYRPDDRCHRAKKKIFSDFTFLYLIGKVIFYRQKFTKTWYLYFFVFQKLLRFINYWNQAVHIVFMSKKIQKLNVFVTQVTCFQNLAFKSYTSFDFINTYSRYRLKIIKLWWYIPPENYQITFETTETFTFQYRRIITF